MLLCNASGVYGQAAPAPGESIGPNVFTLDTRDPSVLTVTRAGTSTRASGRKLTMRVRETVAFRIIHINPLRYNYYLNGQLVTQFMDNSPVASALNELTGAVPVSDIFSLDVFNMDKEVFNQKVEIDKAKEELNVLKDKARAVQLEMKQLIDSAESLSEANRKPVEKMINKKYNQQEDIATLLYDKVNDLDLMLNKLAINANSVEIIKGLRQSLEQYTGNEVVKDHVSRMQNSINRYLEVDMICGEIKGSLNSFRQESRSFESYASLSNYVKNRKKESVDPQLLPNLNRIGYSTGNLWSILTSTDPKIGVQERLEIFRIEEFLTDKKIASLGNLLTELFLEVGKMLEDSYTRFSRELNDMKNRSSINSNDDVTLQKISADIAVIFSMIQTVKADVAVLTVFMQINNPQSRDLGKTINSLYKSLLNFLKVSDYIKVGTTSKYTLAMHANGSNIDLIRYTVKQEDILSKNTQQYAYDIWLKGGLKVDFSVGIFATGLVDDAYEKKPFLVNSDAGLQPSDTAFSLAKKEKGKYGFAFGGMVNISPRLGASWITPGLSIGIAYGDNQNLQFIAAGSLHLGKSERILLHAGCVMGMAKVLDNSAITYTDNTNKYVSGDIGNYPIPMADKFQGRFIFGISYNLSRKNALQAVSGQGLTKFNSSMEAVQ